METQAAAGQKLDSVLTKRELFAAMAMQGQFAKVDGFDQPENIATYAVECADALLKELAK